MTQGNITRKLIAFALPLLLGALIQQLYSTVNMMFVDRKLSTEAAVAVGASNMIVNYVVGFFTGLSVGVGVAVGKSVGGKDETILSKFIHTDAALTLLMGLLIITATTAPRILVWMHVSPDLLPKATMYICMRSPKGRFSHS